MNLISVEGEVFLLVLLFVAKCVAEPIILPSIATTELASWSFIGHVGAHKWCFKTTCMKDKRSAETFFNLKSATR